MKFHEFKILEKEPLPSGTNDQYMDRIVYKLVTLADEACKLPKFQRQRNVRRINSLLTNLRRTSQQYDGKKTIAAIAAKLKNRSLVLSSLVSKTKFQANNELIINANGESEPPFTADMCGPPVGPNDIGGGTGSGTKQGNGTKQGDGNTQGTSNGTVPFGSSLGGKGGKDGKVPGYTPGDGGDGTSNTGTSTKPGNSDVGTDSYASEIGELSGLIEKGDKEGAISYLDANPEFEKAIGNSFRTDIQKSIDADNAAEANRIAKEKAEQEAKAAANAKAKKQAEEEFDAWDGAVVSSESEKVAREKVLKAQKEAEAAKAAKEKAAEEKAAKEAEEKRIEADRLEKERKEAEAEAERIREKSKKEKITVKPDPKEKPIEPGDVEEYNWEDLQP
tara:strand:+ start:1271 stop:2440 length:1170 start_codon:yes stop_codon:yes gene_type:complete